jgi:hypothetical protein
MVQKYDMPAESPAGNRVLTCDIYLAALLLCRQCTLVRVLKNERRRVSFVLEGEQADQIRKEYRNGQPVRMNLRYFREMLLTTWSTAADSGDTGQACGF